MKKELAAKYDHKAVESHYYADWLKEGYFTAGDKSKDPAAQCHRKASSGPCVGYDAARHHRAL